MNLPVLKSLILFHIKTLFERRSQVLLRLSMGALLFGFFSNKASAEVNASVTGGGYHSVLLKRDGSLWGTGFNGSGQLGYGWGIDTKVFTEAVSADVTAIAAGHRHTLFLKSDGSLWAMGKNKSKNKEY